MVFSAQGPYEHMNTGIFCGGLQVSESKRADSFAGPFGPEVDTQLGRAVICLSLFVLGYETIPDDCVLVRDQERGVFRVSDKEKFFQIFFCEFPAVKCCR
jgi:hypothetical protein